MSRVWYTINMKELDLVYNRKAFQNHADKFCNFWSRTNYVCHILSVVVNMNLVYMEIQVHLFDQLKRERKKGDKICARYHCN